MKVFIMCRSYLTRLEYEGKIKFKPMVEIDQKPVFIDIIENFFN